MNPTNRSSPRLALPLRLVLIVPFVLQVFGAVSLVGYLSFRNGQKAVNNLANQLMERTGSTVNQHLSAYLSIPHKISQLNADAVRMGLLDVRDRQKVGQYFWRQMQAFDANNISYLGIGLKSGEGVGTGRYDGKTITLDDWGPRPPKNWYSYALDDQGKRTRVLAVLDWNNFAQPWYNNPIKANKPVWSPIYTVDYPNSVYITIAAARPLYDSGNQLLGMISTDISLLSLSDFLRNLEVSRAGQVFLLERDGTLIASSNKEPFYIRRNKDIQRLKAIDSPNSLVRETAKSLLQHFNHFQHIDATQNLKLDVQGETHYVQVSPWRDTYGLDWLVVMSVPERAFMAEIDANTRFTLLLSLAALMGASVLGVFTARWITNPIERLNQASKAIASGNLDQRVEVSSIQEVDTLAHSFNHMANQLRESFQALEKSNEELEERVELRTVELKNTLNELQRTQAQIVQSEKMSSLGQLVAGVAHEINNPVNFIHGNLTHAQEYTQDLLEFVQLYQQHYPNPVPAIQIAAEDIDLEFVQGDLPKTLASMRVGTDRIRQIVLSLRNFSRMDEAELKPVNIHEGIDSTLMILQHRLKAQTDRPAIEVVKDYGDLPLVECYAGQLNQVFMNILTNAIDALEEGNAQRSSEAIWANPNRITISTAIAAEWAQIAIEDNGKGIPTHVQPYIFNPFFTIKPIGKGTGMGLAISYQIITEKHSGKLECYSTPGKDTKFVIQIPIVSTC